MPTERIFLSVRSLFPRLRNPTGNAARSPLEIQHFFLNNRSGLGTAQRFIHSALTAVRWCLWGSPRTQRALYTLLFDTTVGFLVYCIPLVRAVQHSCWSRALLGSYPRSVVVVLLLVVHEASCGASLHVRVQAKL